MVKDWKYFVLRLPVYRSVRNGSRTNTLHRTVIKRGRTFGPPPVFYNSTQGIVISNEITARYAPMGAEGSAGISYLNVRASLKPPPR